MAIINTHNLGRSFGADDIFSGVTVSIPHGSRIALVGPNGSGKTTLLKLLSRLDEPTEGTVTHAKGLQIGVLPQESDLSLKGAGTLSDEMLTVFADLIQQEARLEELAERLVDHQDEELLKAYGIAQEKFEVAGGYEYQITIQQVLGGLGFDESDFNRPVGQLSGGQKTRALLARLLLENPDLLILDEPTNHLDIQAIEWLEHWIKSYEGALLIVSHDRYFMDSVVNHIWELRFGGIQEFRGNYSAYLQQREDRWAHADEIYEREKERLLKDVDFIKRNMGSRGTTQAQGRLKRLTRQITAIEEVGLMNAVNASSWARLGISVERPFSVEEAERRVKNMSRPVRNYKPLTLNLRAEKRSGDKVLMTRGLVLGYHDDGIPLFEAPDITLYRGECAALIGPNGAGKTTFLKTVLGHLEPLKGEAKIGASVEIGYFAQAHEELNTENTILDEILSLRNMPISEVRNYLGGFLFSGDEVYKPVSTLSGGERGRVALAKLALSGANLLLLDEPTNHLDIPSQEILEAVLAEFSGTILLVSHDRYLISNLATQIWALHVPRKTGEKTELVVHEGPYDEYIALRDGRPAPVKKAVVASEPVLQAQQKSTITPYERRKRLAAVEQRIHQLEVDLVNLSGELEAASSSGAVGEVTRLGAAYTDTEAALEKLMIEWETLAIES